MKRRAFLKTILTALAAPFLPRVVTEKPVAATVTMEDIVDANKRIDDANAEFPKMYLTWNGRNFTMTKEVPSQQESQEVISRPQSVAKAWAEKTDAMMMSSIA